MQISEPAEYALLGLLQSHPMHGYEMFQHFENGMLGQIVHLEMSQMYAYLKKLERLTYIQAQIQTQGTRPPRKIFQLTPAGQEVLQQWLTQPVNKPRDIRIYFLIKLYFVQRYQPGQVIQLMQQQQQACEQFLHSLQKMQEQPVKTTAEALDADFFAQVVLSSRIYQTRALLAWLKELQQEKTSLLRRRE